MLQALGKLMATMGKTMDTEKNQQYMDEIFRLLERHSNNVKINSRMRYMIKDLDELRVRQAEVALINYLGNIGCTSLWLVLATKCRKRHSYVVWGTRSPSTASVELLLTLR